MGGGKGPGPIPPRWLNCPRKSSSLIGNRCGPGKAVMVVMLSV